MTTFDHERHDGPALARPRAMASGAARRGGAKTIEAALSGMLTGAVIPRLVARARESAPVPVDAQRDLLLRLVLRGEREGARALVERCVGAGMRADAIAEGLIAPVARGLGRGWEEDTCDFVAVTFATALLAELMTRLREIDPPRFGRALGERPSVLLGPVPGEQHGLGVAIVADAFERAGWEVHRTEAPTASGLLAQLAAQSHDALGLSCAADRNLDGLGELIAALRRVSRNPGLGVIVGGPALLRRPEAGTRSGADAVAIDAKDGVAAARAWLSPRA
ncbi:MAG: B12-binding domain-containing protein [Paracoccaceae bacterium]